jgi:hypothetical protein
MIEQGKLCRHVQPAFCPAVPNCSHHHHHHRHHQHRHLRIFGHSDVREFITVTSVKSGIEDEILSLTVSFRGLRGKLHETIPNTSTMKAKDLKKLVQKSKHDMTNNFFNERREQAEKLWREGHAEHANKRHRAR